VPTRIYVDRTAIERNGQDGKRRPVFLLVTEDYEETPAHGVRITGECELIYQPLGSPIPGAQAFLVVSATSKVELINPKIGESTNER
jgi:hypothetical protein